MKKILYAILCFSVMLCASCGKDKGESSFHESDDSMLQVVRYEYGIAVDSFSVVSAEVAQGETLGGIFDRAGVPANIVRQLTTLSKTDFDPRSLRPGKEYLVFYPILDFKTLEADSVPRYLVYKSSITNDVVFHLTDSLHVEHQQKEVLRQPRVSHAVIESSLWSALVGQGLSPQLAVELSDVYQWTIDFFGLQKGDSVVAYYEELYVDTMRIGIGQIFAAQFYHAGATIPAYRFYSDEYPALSSLKDPIHGYFCEDGKSLKKAFLKAPLNYKRISSTFTYARKHPIYKTVRPHTGVDYAAPQGTPVVALGDGKVIEKGYKGGGGNTVKIRHNATYTTAYLHLSKYGKGIEVGKHVQQGQVIGYVGSTGASTGPHLDFRVWKNGTPVNPLTLESPTADPVPESCKQTFDSIVSIYKTELGIKN